MDTSLRQTPGAGLKGIRLRKKEFAVIETTGTQGNQVSLCDTNSSINCLASVHRVTILSTAVMGVVD